MLDVVVADRDRVGVAERGARDLGDAPRPEPRERREKGRRVGERSGGRVEPLLRGCRSSGRPRYGGADAERVRGTAVRRRGRDPAATSIPTAPAPARRARGLDGSKRRAPQPVTFCSNTTGTQPLRDEVRPGSAGRARDARAADGARWRISRSRRRARRTTPARARSATGAGAPGLDLDAVRDVGEPGRRDRRASGRADGDPALRAHRRAARPTQRHASHVDRMRCPDEPRHDRRLRRTPRSAARGGPFGEPLGAQRS